MPGIATVWAGDLVGARNRQRSAFLNASSPTH